MNNNCEIILELAKKQEEYTLLELSKTLNIPYTTLLRTSAKLNDVTEIRIKGKAKLIRLKWNEITKANLVIASYEEKKQIEKKHKIIKKINEKTKNTTILFGSYATGKENKKSDIDLIIINKKGDKNESYMDLEILYDKKINPIFMNEKEFKEMLRSKQENVVKQAYKNNIVLKNQEQFWNIIEDGIYKKTIS